MLAGATHHIPCLQLCTSRKHGHACALGMHIMQPELKHLVVVQAVQSDLVSKQRTRIDSCMAVEQLVP